MAIRRQHCSKELGTMNLRVEYTRTVVQYGTAYGHSEAYDDGYGDLGYEEIFDLICDDDVVEWETDYIDQVESTEAVYSCPNCGVERSEGYEILMLDEEDDEQDEEDEDVPVEEEPVVETEEARVRRKALELAAILQRRP
jgi:hypothetical protein